MKVIERSTLIGSLVIILLLNYQVGQIDKKVRTLKKQVIEIKDQQERDFDEMVNIWSAIKTNSYTLYRNASNMTHQVWLRSDNTTFKSSLIDNTKYISTYWSPDRILELYSFDKTYANITNARFYPGYVGTIQYMSNYYRLNGDSILRIHQ